MLVDCLPRGERLRIEVRDSGIGIPSEHIEQIWDEFHQVGNPERDRTQGLGLGLTIVKRIAASSGCSVDVRSSPEEASVFAIEVPLGEAKPEFAPAGKPVRPVSANENADGKFAVLVDDDVIVLLGLQMLMKQLGYKVLIAASTEQAIGQLREVASKPDIVVADYRLREGKVGTEAVFYGYRALRHRSSRHHPDRGNRTGIAAGRQPRPAHHSQTRHPEATGSRHPEPDQDRPIGRG